MSGSPSVADWITDGRGFMDFTAGDDVGGRSGGETVTGERASSESIGLGEARGWWGRRPVAIGGIGEIRDLVGACVVSITDGRGFMDYTDGNPAVGYLVGGGVTGERASSESIGLDEARRWR